MIQYHVFPGGKKRVVTFSYDDGHINDERLAKLFTEKGIKATFHLHGKYTENLTETEVTNLRKRYEGHEISCHTLHHGWPTRMPQQSLVNEILENRKHLENIANYPVVGMSYPSGDYSDETDSVFKACGIVYSRTVNSTNNFPLPTNFLQWHPTCHHSSALALCDKFLNNIDSEWTLPLFYVWGHSFELTTEEDWAYMDTLLDKISGNDKIWYATNIEIYNYMTAQRQLVISLDEKTFTNPTALDLWVEKDKTQIIKIPAGQTVRI